MVVSDSHASCYKKTLPVYQDFLVYLTIWIKHVKNHLCISFKRYYNLNYVHNQLLKGIKSVILCSLTWDQVPLKLSSEWICLWWESKHVETVGIKCWNYLLTTFLIQQERSALLHVTGADLNAHLDTHSINLSIQMSNDTWTLHYSLKATDIKWSLKQVQTLLSPVFNFFSSCTPHKNSCFPAN